MHDISWSPSHFDDFLLPLLWCYACQDLAKFARLGFVIGARNQGLLC